MKSKNLTACLLGTAFAGLLGTMLCGCASTAGTLVPQSAYRPYTAELLQEGDVIQIAFPGATNLNSLLKIPLDGVVRMPVVGDFKATGKTLKELQEEILEVFGPQLQLKEVLVTLVSSSAAVYVSGAVLRPGKVPLDRPLTALEAIMETGGFDNARAKPDRVLVVRQEDDHQIAFRIDLSKPLKGAPADPIYLRPFDVVHVPFKTFNL